MQQHDVTLAGLVFFGLAVMTLSYSPYRPDTMFLREHIGNRPQRLKPGKSIGA
jgi:hypothetical protein